MIEQIEYFLGHHLDWNAIFYGFSMAGIDAIVLAMIKLYSIGKIKTLYFMILASIVYAFQPWIFLRSLKHESMTVMNLFWDLSSDIIVTIIGLFIFGEELNIYKKIGIFFAFIALAFMSYEEIV